MIFSFFCAIELFILCLLKVVNECDNIYLTLGDIVLPYFILGTCVSKGGSAMVNKIEVALACINKASVIMGIVAEAGKAVIALFKE